MTGPADPQDQVPQNDQAPPADPKPPKTYTAEEVEAKLRGQGSELERLRRMEEEFKTLKASEAQKELEAAKQRGEWETLYSKEQQRNTTLEQERGALSSELEALQALLAAEVAEQVAGIEDGDTQKKVSDLLKDRPVLEQREILRVVLDVRGVQPTGPARQGGAPGRPKPPGVDMKRFRTDPQYRQSLALQIVRRS